MDQQPQWMHFRWDLTHNILENGKGPNLKIGVWKPNRGCRLFQRFGGSASGLQLHKATLVRPDIADEPAQVLRPRPAGIGIGA